MDTNNSLKTITDVTQKIAINNHMGQLLKKNNIDFNISDIYVRFENIAREISSYFDYFKNSFEYNKNESESLILIAKGKNITHKYDFQFGSSIKDIFVKNDKLIFDVDNSCRKAVIERYNENLDLYEIVIAQNFSVSNEPLVVSREVFETSGIRAYLFTGIEQITEKLISERILGCGDNYALQEFELKSIYDSVLRVNE